MTPQQRFKLLHPERVTAAIKRWQKKHREQWLAGRRRYYQKCKLRDIEKVRRLNREARQRWRNKHRIESRAYDSASRSARRAKKYGTQSGLTGINKFIARIRRKKRVRCYYCRRFTAGRLAHIDHITPLKSGGHHVIGNLCAACPKCNLTKHTKSVSEFHPTSQPLLSL